MSILIKGLAMPKNCGECSLQSIFSGYKCMALKKTFDKYPLEQRMDWCPLVELPPHEDLIGRNAAIRSAFKGEQNIYCWDEIEEALDGVPAIIESEGEG